MLGLIIGNISDTEILQYLEQGLTAVGKSNSAMVGRTLLDHRVAVEAAHLGNSKHINA